MDGWMDGHTFIQLTFPKTIWTELAEPPKIMLLVSEILVLIFAPVLIFLGPRSDDAITVCSSPHGLLKVLGRYNGRSSHVGEAVKKSTYAIWMLDTGMEKPGLELSKKNTLVFCVFRVESP